MGDIGSEYQLTSGQLAIWFAQNIDPKSPAYNIGEYYEITGAIDAALFSNIYIFI